MPTEDDPDEDLSFNLDYHETEDFQNAVYAMGRFILDWNFAENNFGHLLASFAGESGSILMLGLGNQSKSDAMMELARSSKAGPEFLEAIDFACKAFGRLKDNRNALAHAHTVVNNYENPKPQWIRQPRNPKSYSVYVFADSEDIVINTVAAGQLAMYLMKLLIYSGNFHGTLGDSERPLPPLPEKFELPDALTPHSRPRSLLRDLQKS